MDENTTIEQLFGLSNQSIFSLGDMFLAMSLTTVLVFVLGHVYKKTHNGPHYSKTFIISLLVMSIATSVVMMIIGSNIARAFSLVGALSIIRFRTAVKDPRDTAFLFVGIVAGMGTGTGFYVPSISLVLFISVLLLILDGINYSSKESLDTILKVIMPDDADEKKLEQTIAQTVKKYQLINKVNDFSGQNLVHVYLLRGKTQKKMSELEKALKELSYIKEINFYETDRDAPF